MPSPHRAPVRRSRRLAALTALAAAPLLAACTHTHHVVVHHVVVHHVTVHHVVVHHCYRSLTGRQVCS